MRKGVLYTTAKKLGCNKVAFAHHADDLIETLFMSMLFEGRLNTFHPKVYLSRSDITLIRPLILVEEKYIINQSRGLPIQKILVQWTKQAREVKQKNLLSTCQKWHHLAKKDCCQQSQQQTDITYLTNLINRLNN